MAQRRTRRGRQLLRVLFTRKVGQGIGGAVAAFTIGLGGYVSGATSQPPGATTSIRVAAGAVPAAVKAELHDAYPHLLPAWYACRDNRARRRAVEWLADHSLIDDETANRYRNRSSNLR